MKIALVRNTPRARVLRRRGRQNREFYKESDIEAARDALAELGHDVEIFEGDATLPDVLRRKYGDAEGIVSEDLFVFNMAYGIQGNCRYTHIPSMLEMLGVPYLCSDPRGHTISLDKYLAKILLARAALPTPAFGLLEAATDPLADALEYPLVLKPQFESTSYGLRVVEDREQLEAAAAFILTEFRQPALLEAFIDGREVNCALLGNAPAMALPIVEIEFGELTGRDRICTFESKRDRVIGHECPADLPPALTREVQELSVRAFEALGCRDLARVDFRIDQDGRPWILEVNSMAAIHPDGSYYYAARTLGWSYPEMLGRILDAALSRTRPSQSE